MDCAFVESLNVKSVNDNINFIGVIEHIQILFSAANTSAPIILFSKMRKKEKKSDAIITALFFFLMQELTSLILSKQYQCLAHTRMAHDFAEYGTY